MREFAQHYWRTIARAAIHAVVGAALCAVLGTALNAIPGAIIGLAEQLDPTPLPEYSKYDRETITSGAAGGAVFGFFFGGCAGGLLWGFLALLHEPIYSLLPSKPLFVKTAMGMTTTMLGVTAMVCTGIIGSIVIDPGRSLSDAEGNGFLIALLFPFLMICGLLVGAAIGHCEGESIQHKKGQLPMEVTLADITCSQMLED
jgi:hypothetical protein